MGPYPGGVPYLTDKYINEPGINKTPGQRTNGTIKTTVQTKTRDQDFINVGQIAFMDARVSNKPVLLNLQQLNLWLARDFPQLLNSNPLILHQWIQTGQRGALNTHQAEMAYIMKNFKLYGVVVNPDSDNEHNMPFSRSSRVFTCAVRGATFILDYWSTNKKLLSQYTECYFVLKKVLMKKGQRIQTKLSSTMTGGGHNVSDTLGDQGTYCWQIVPFAGNMTPDAYSWDHKVYNSQANPPAWSEHGKQFGTFWRVGTTHEHADIGDNKLFSRRGELSVSHDIGFLHQNGKVIPMQFYLKLDTNCS